MTSNSSTDRVRLRLIGAPESVALVLDQLAGLGADISASAMYPPRYSTGHVRIYAEITPPGMEK